LGVKGCVKVDCCYYRHKEKKRKVGGGERERDFVKTKKAKAQWGGE